MGFRGQGVSSDGPGGLASEEPESEQALSGRSGSRSAGQSSGSRGESGRGSRAAEGSVLKVAYGERKRGGGLEKAEKEVSAGALGPSTWTAAVGVRGSAAPRGTPEPSVA